MFENIIYRRVIWLLGDIKKLCASMHPNLSNFLGQRKGTHT
jgi:hypothetical protein